MVQVVLWALFEVVRFPQNPIIAPQSHPSLGPNINGPSLIRVPDWVERPLGRYYLYFAAHNGTYIRLAYAPRLEGPWTIHESGILRLEEVPACQGHIASPDVHVDEEAKRIRMYFHGPAQVTERNMGQKSFVALSNNGLHFTPRPEILGAPYFTVFQWRDCYYAIGTRGFLYRSRDGLRDFEPGPALFGGNTTPNEMRHCAVKLDGDVLYVFYSRIADSPERILVSKIVLTPDWNQWQESVPVTVLQPEAGYEGADCALRPSRSGAAPGRVRELRDPAIFEEGGKTYLLYSIAGESGIAMAELKRSVE